MKVGPLLSAIVFLGILVSAGLGCTCVDGPLDKRFRRAKAVFVGGLYDHEDDDIPRIQNYRKGLPVLLVRRSWKGVKSELVAVDFEFPLGASGNCPLFYRFEESTDYLVFAYGPHLKVTVECSDTHPLTSEYTSVNWDIKRLDSFWFRFRSRVFPF